MRAEARIAAAIEILDRVLGGVPTEQALTNWARGARYAGSKDRAAVRDLVFQSVRCQRSYAWLGGSETGRGLMLGALRAEGVAPSTVFTGQGHAPDVLAIDEVPDNKLADAPQAVRFDLPDWLAPVFAEALGDDFALVAQLMRTRAPVFLRANTVKCTPDAAIAALAQDDIFAQAHTLSPTALVVVENARRLRQSSAYLKGLVELQDAASQAVVDHLPNSRTALDFCAGGGGKSLALAARGTKVIAHDANAQRMADLPQRASRAGVTINTVSSRQLASTDNFELVLCDVPCSGSGSWRRAPDGKWRLSPQNLQELNQTQDEILRDAAQFVRPQGTLAYVTCSMLPVENMARVQAFLDVHPNWSLSSSASFSPIHGGDGFFVACLKMA